MSEAETPERRSWLARLAEGLDDPILLLQLRAAFRRKRFSWLQTGLLSVLAAVVLITMWSLTETYKDDTSEIGRRTFLVFTGVELALVLFVFPAFSCTSITDERTNKSLDLLLTTRLTPERIVLGKMLAAFVYGLLFIVATLPLVALTFLFGGVTPGQIALTYGVLATAALVVTLFALSVSSTMGSTLRSVLTTYVGLFFIVFPAIAPLVDTSLLVDPWSHAWPSAGNASGVLAVHVLGPLLHSEPAVAIRDAIRHYDGLETVLYWGTHVAFYASLSSFFFLVARHRLAPSGTNRSTPFRAWFALTVATALGGTLLGLAHENGHAALNAGTTFNLFQEIEACVFIALVVAAVCFAAEDPVVPRRVRAAGERHRGPLAWLRAFYPGARQGERYVLWLAVATQLALGAVFLVSLELERVSGESLLREGVHVLEWSTGWTLAFVFFLVELAVLLACEVRHAAQARLWVVVYLVFATLFPVFWFYVDDQGAKPRLWEGYVLSPWTVSTSVAYKDGERDRRLMLLSPSGREIREALNALARRIEDVEASDPAAPIAAADLLEKTRRELATARGGAVSEDVIAKTLACVSKALARTQAELTRSRKDANVVGASSAALGVGLRVKDEARAELSAELTGEGIPIHEVSTALYAVLGLLLWATNRKRLARAEQAPA